MKPYIEVQARITDLYFEYMDIRDRLISEGARLEDAQAEADAQYESKREVLLQSLGWDLVQYKIAQREDELAFYKELQATPFTGVQWCEGDEPDAG